MTELNSEEMWSRDPEPERSEPTDTGADGDWFDDVFDDDYMDDDPISEEEAMDWARRYGGDF